MEFSSGLFTYSDPGEVIAASNVGVLVVVVVLCPVDLDHLWAKVGISNQPIYPSTCHRPSWDPNIFVVVKKTLDLHRRNRDGLFFGLHGLLTARFLFQRFNFKFHLVNV